MKEVSQSRAAVFQVGRVIDEIAFQCNILALHAAVEAAYGGEPGAHGTGESGAGALCTLPPRRPSPPDRDESSS